MFCDRAARLGHEPLDIRVVGVDLAVWRKAGHVCRRNHSGQRVDAVAERLV